MEIALWLCGVAFKHEEQPVTRHKSCLNLNAGMESSLYNSTEDHILIRSEIIDKVRRGFLR